MLHILPMAKEMDRHTIYIVNCRRPPLNIFIQQKTHTTKPPQPPPYIQHIENLRIYVYKQYIYTHKSNTNRHIYLNHENLKAGSPNVATSRSTTTDPF